MITEREDIPKLLASAEEIARQRKYENLINKLQPAEDLILKLNHEIQEYHDAPDLPNRLHEACDLIYYSVCLDRQDPNREVMKYLDDRVPGKPEGYLSSVLAFLPPDECSSELYVELAAVKYWEWRRLHPKNTEIELQLIMMRYNLQRRSM